MEHGGDVLTGKLSRFVPVSGMSLKRAATILALRNPDLDTIPGKDTDGRMIQG